MEGLSYLKKRYDLHNAPEVKSAVARHEAISEEKVPQDPLVQIQTYFDRFKEISERTNPQERERGIRALKEVLHRANVVEPDNISESYFNKQKEIFQKEGRPYTAEDRQRSIEGIQTDQIDSLDRWVDYLSGPDALYPDWAKYWFAKSVLAMGPYDTKKHEYSKRSKGTTTGFPELNPESLSIVADIMEKKLTGQVVENPVELIPNPQNPEEKKRFTDEQFAKLLTTENFAKYYAFANEFAGADNSEHFPIIEGEWKMYPQGSMPDELVDSLQGQGTRWCTAGKGTAQNQLSQGDFYVYYSKNALGNNSIPRVAIRMYGDKISEVRGVDAEADQDLDRYIAPVVAEKMQEFGSGGEKYIKMAERMEQLTDLEDKQAAGEELTVEELRFIYELDGRLKTFSQREDGNPRIEKLRTNRAFKEDMVKIFEGADDNEIAANMANASSVKLLAKNLELFKDLNPAIVTTLIEEGHVFSVINNLDSFTAEVKPILIDEWFSVHGNDFFEHIKLFDLEQQAYALDAIANTPGGLQIISKNLGKITVLKPEIANAIIAAGYGETLEYHLYKIPAEAQNQIIRDLAERRELSNYFRDEAGHGLAEFEPQTLLCLLDNEYYDVVLRGLSGKRGSLPAEIALALMDKGFVSEVASNLRAFSKNEFHLIAERLIESGHAEKLITESPWESLDAKLAPKIIEAVGGEVFLNKLNSFTGAFDAQVAELLLSSGQISAYALTKVVENLALFEGLDHDILISRMVEAGTKGFQLELNKFEDGSLSEEVAKKLIFAEENYALNVIGHLDKFRIENHDAFVDFLLTTENGREAFISKSNQFENHIDPKKRAKKLWQAGGYLAIYEIEGIEHNELLRELITAGDAAKIIERLELDFTEVLSSFTIDDFTDSDISSAKDAVSKVTTQINAVKDVLADAGLVDAGITDRFNTLLEKFDYLRSQLLIRELELTE